MPVRQGPQYEWNLNQCKVLIHMRSWERLKLGLRVVPLSSYQLRRSAHHLLFGSIPNNRKLPPRPPPCATIPLAIRLAFTIS